MKKEIFEKMERFVELSAKFSKEEEDLFPKRDNNSIIMGSGHSFATGTANHNYSSDGLIVSGTLVLNNKEIFTDGYGHVKSRDLSEPTRADEIRERARVLAKLSDEFDEYNKLRSDLNSYFESIKNLLD